MEQKVQDKYRQYLSGPPWRWPRIHLANGGGQLRVSLRGLSRGWVRFIQTLLVWRAPWVMSLDFREYLAPGKYSFSFFNEWTNQTIVLLLDWMVSGISRPTNPLSKCTFLGRMRRRAEGCGLLEGPLALCTPSGSEGPPCHLTIV